jgi:hypothetical protein
MQRAHARPMYTGYPGQSHLPLGLAGHHQHHHGAPGHGFCAGCGHPHSSCCCGCRQCRKESRELLVEPTTSRSNLRENPNTASALARMSMFTAFADTTGGDTATAAEHAPASVLNAEALKAGAIGLGTAFIGGSCCVHLSVEYTPSGTADGIVGVLVQEGNDTQLVWLKRAAAGLGYQIKECIVTTKPGAHLTALAVGATARVRWCEVFSC